jgi:Mycoplasma protein of unknown function, DUF285
MTVCVFHPKTKPQLYAIVRNAINELGPSANLNHINVSAVEDFGELFSSIDKKFNGNISEWDMSNAVSTMCMFESCAFNGDVSNWRTPKLRHVYGMFYRSAFDGDISRWNVSQVVDFGSMLSHSTFSGDLRPWRLSKKQLRSMFYDGTELKRYMETREAIEFQATIQPLLAVLPGPTAKTTRAL